MSKAENILIAIVYRMGFNICGYKRDFICILILSDSLFSRSITSFTRIKSFAIV